MEPKTKKDLNPHFRQNLCQPGEVKTKLGNLALPFGFSVLGALTGAGSTLLASQYVWADKTQLPPTADMPENCEALQQQPLPQPNPTAAGVADVCTLNLDHLSFGKAFAAARNECGAGAVFIWQGRPFNTFYKEEWQDLSAADKTEFNTAVANLNAELKEVIADNDYQVATNIQPIDVEPLNTLTTEQDDDIEAKDITQVSHMAIDTDADGYYETVVFLDQQGNVEQINIDTDLSGSTDIHLTPDQIIGISPPEEEQEEPEKETEEPEPEELFLLQTDPNNDPEELNPPSTLLTDYNNDPDFDPNANMTELI